MTNANMNPNENEISTAVNKISTWLNVKYYNDGAYSKTSYNADDTFISAYHKVACQYESENSDWD